MAWTRSKIRTADSGDLRGRPLVLNPVRCHRRVRFGVPHTMGISPGTRATPIATRLPLHLLECLDLMQHNDLGAQRAPRHAPI